MEKKQEITGAEMFELSVSLAPCNSDSLPSNKITIKLTRDHASNVRISLKRKKKKRNNNKNNFVLKA